MLRRVLPLLAIFMTCSVVSAEDYETRPPASVRFATFNIQEMSLKSKRTVNCIL